MHINFLKLEQARILVVGDIMLDRYWQGQTLRISPEAPVPVVQVKATDDRPGGAANVALNLASLGATASLAGIVGQDDNARILHDCLQRAGVLTYFHASAAQPTITKLRVMSRNQQLIRLDFEEPLQPEAGFTQAYAKALATAELVIFSDYAKGTLQNIEPLIQAAHQAGKKILIDPKGTDFTRYRQATLLTPNLSELEAIIGSCSNFKELEEKAEALRQALDLEALIVTLSEKGMLLLRADTAPLHLPTHAQEVFDVTGAGDTVIAVLGLALASGHDYPEAMLLANLAAGLVVAKPGTATLSIAELYSALHKESSLEKGVVTQDLLVQAVRAAQSRGEKVVMTNGCFDLLHAGHVTYLEEARQLGDHLIVAVNSDASVTRLKGSSRPINSLERRMKVLAGLQSVDWVLPFSEDTPAKLIAQVLPDILVKGGDYQPNEIAGATAVQEAGGQVIVLNFIDGLSTSAMVRSILAKPAETPCANFSDGEEN